MRNSSILISGIRGLSNEVCKNLVLAGVGSITIIDHNIVMEEDLGAQFLITEQDLGKNVIKHELLFLFILSCITCR
jgi:ubiquitin-like 1-activating enzyme E1 A